MDSQQASTRFCLYARKSSESEERQTLSIESQVNEMQKLAERDGLEVVDIRRESHSAKQRGTRQVFNEMIKDLHIGKFNAILTWAPDRLSRNAGDLGVVVDLMDKGKLVEIRTFGQTFSNTPNDKFLLMILGSQAKLENDQRGVNVRRGMRARVEMGLWPGVAPLGYLNQYRTDKPCEIVLDEERAPVIRQMFEKVADEGWTIRKIHQWLHEDMEFKTRGSKRFGYSGVQRVLNNPFYYGRFEYPKGSGKWYDGKHTPIITKDLFDRTQKHLKRSYAKKKTKEFSFVKLFTCGLCGSGISAEEKFKTLKDGSVARYVYYGCTRGRDRYCKNLYIREDDLIEQLINIFDQADIDELGIRHTFEEEAMRFGKFQKFIFGHPTTLNPEEIDLNIRAYAIYVLKDGSISEKRSLLGHLRSKLTIKDRTISFASP